MDHVSREELDYSGSDFVCSSSVINWNYFAFIRLPGEYSQCKSICRFLKPLSRVNEVDLSAYRSRPRIGSGLPSLQMFCLLMWLIDFIAAWICLTPPFQFSYHEDYLIPKVNSSSASIGGHNSCVASLLDSSEELNEQIKVKEFNFTLEAPLSKSEWLIARCEFVTVCV